MCGPSPVTGVPLQCCRWVAFMLLSGNSKRGKYVSLVVRTNPFSLQHVFSGEFLVFRSPPEFFTLRKVPKGLYSIFSG